MKNHLVSIIGEEPENFDQANRDRLLNWAQETEQNELMLTTIAREEMLKDHQYYDGQQWSPEDAQVLEERGQAAVSYNFLKSRVDWMSGTQRRAPVDFKVLPRKSGEDAAKDAAVKTDALKYLTDVNRAPAARANAFKEALIGGLSFLEVAIIDDPTQEALYTGHEHWWNMIWDSCSQKLDGSDMRYQFRCRNLDLDVAIKYFPKVEDGLRRASTGTQTPGSGMQYYLGSPLNSYQFNDYSASAGYQWMRFDQMGWQRTTRERINIRETHYYVPVLQKVQSRGGSIFDRVQMCPYIMLWADNLLIDVLKSPYKHGRLPFLPLWCYRKAVTNAPYGMIRQQRDPQDSYNKRMSKALFAASSTRVEIEQGALDPKSMTLAELRNEVSKVNGVLQFATKALVDGKVRITDGRAIADAHIGFAQQDHQFIADAFGVNSENLGLKTNVVSGIALERKQSEGSVQTTEPFDNLHSVTELEGIMSLSNFEAYYLDRRDFRLDNGQGGHRFATINEWDGEQFKNDVTQFSADFVMEQASWSSTLAQAATEQLWGLLKEIAPIDPQVVRSLLDIVVQYSPALPGKSEIVKRIRAINGQRDPDAPESPEEKAARAEAQQEQQIAKQMALREANAKLNKLEAEGGLIDAKRVREFVTAFFSAMQAGQVVGTMPMVAPIGDSMLQSSGFQDQGGQNPNVPQPTAPTAGPYVPQLPSPGTGQARGIETVRPDSVVTQ